MSEHKPQNYATSGWILTFFAVVVQQECRTVPPSMEGHGALEAMIEARMIAVANTNSSKHKHQNYATSDLILILTFYVLRLFSKVVGQSQQVVWRDKEL